MSIGNGPGGKEFFDWDRFQSQFFSENVWKDAIQNRTGSAPWIEQYVQNILSNVMPPMTSKDGNSFPQTATNTKVQILDTHHYLIVRMLIPEQVDFAALRIFLGFNRLLIKGLETEESVVLPSCVNSDKSRAILKNRVLEVRMPKEAEEHLKELPIQVL